jgi:hypothetical protein
MLLDNTATGRNRMIREIAAGIINPVAFLNRFLRNEAFRQFENPADRFPSLVVLSTDIGYRRFEHGTHPNQWIATLSFLYGDPFEGDLSRPFDSFWVGIAVARVPLGGPLGAGVGYSWYSRKTSYPGFFEERKKQSEWRAFVNAAFPFKSP